MDLMIDTPISLCISLAQNEDALKSFITMSEAEKAVIIEKSQGIASKIEMDAFITSISE